jgi:hypothetical protein
MGLRSLGEKMVKLLKLYVKYVVCIATEKEFVENE